MSLRIIGAGIGRTGTLSLKLALEQLLGAPCYHMLEVLPRPEHIPLWHDAARGRMPDWHVLFEGYAAAVDWPASAFWPEIVAAYPEALVLLSVRDSEDWWQSASSTIFPATQSAEGDWRHMIDAMFAARFTTDIENKAACIAAYEAHNAQVRARVPASRLIEWQPGDGWQPICAALGLAVPSEPFPHTNTTAEFNERHRP